MDTRKLRERLLEIARLARHEKLEPNGVRLSIIERNAKAALAVINAVAGSELTPTPPHLRIEAAE